MKKELRVLILYTALFLIEINLFGQFSTNAHVATFSQSTLAYSAYHFREVNVITGSILRSKTEDQGYDTNADYILIWFSQNEVAIIKLRDRLFDFGQRLNFDSMDESLFKIVLMSKKKTMEGFDQDNSKWRICFGSEYDKYSCDTKTDGLYYLIDGSKKLSKLIEEYNRILEQIKSSSISSNCDYYKTQLKSIESQAKELKDRFEYGSFLGNDPYWDSYLEFLGSCTEVEKRSYNLSLILCKQ